MVCGCVEGVGGGGGCTTKLVEGSASQATTNMCGRSKPVLPTTIMPPLVEAKLSWAAYPFR